jgi:hypothetical protein
MSTVNPAGGTDDYRRELNEAGGELVNVIEKKVTASTSAATITTIIIAALGVYVFKGHVPDWATVLIETAVTGGLTFLAGYVARHTPRTPAVTGSPATPPTDPQDGSWSQRSM